MTAEYIPQPQVLADEKLDRDVFLVHQKQLSLGSSKFFIEGESGERLLYVERPVMRFFGRRGDITFFDDESARVPVLVAKQDHGFEFLRRDYTLVDAEGDFIARLQRDNVRALFRRAWNITDPDGTLIARAQEDNVAMSIVRRVVDWIPFVGLLGFVIKTDFHILAVGDDGIERKIGTFNRKIGIVDRYVMDLSDDLDRRFDRRIAVALGILLDTAEAR